MKQFNNAAILTTKNPEAFLNFTYDACEYWIIPDCCIGIKILYVNGLDVNNYLGTPSIGYALKLDATNNIASFHVYSDINYKFDTNLTFHFYDSSTFVTEASTFDVSILNRPYILQQNLVNTFTNDDLLVDDEASYLLLRTNPKFTGNIKLYVDASENMFLDTFKISDILSNKKYRHQQVSANSVLSSDIRNTFSSLPLGELYRVDVDDTLSIAIPKTELKDQYRLNYNYGATLLKDELYTEDNGILAPLWINSKLPDYFAVFRLPGVYNRETYDGSSLAFLASDYLRDSDLIRSWSLKPSDPLGKYLATHTTDVVKIQAPVFLSLTDPSSRESDPNTWYGIAVDKGVLTGRSETTYFFNKKANNFTDLNAFVSQGFERNTLLCPNIVNMEFIFDDNDVSLYTMNRYFGFYLTENILYQIAYYANSSTGQVEILSLDSKDSSVFMHSDVFDASGNISSQYSNRILVVNDGVQLHRFTNVNEINDSIINSYTSKPLKNIFSVTAEQTNINPFITLTLNNLLDEGEHLRIVNKTQNKIWEVYGVNASSYSCDKYSSITIDASDHYPVVFRTYFNTCGTMAQQIRELEKAFDRFEDYEKAQFRSGIRGSNWFSIILNDNASTSEEWYFQRLTSSTRTIFDDPSSSFNNAGRPEDITFFGRFTPTVSDYGVVAFDSSYGPIDFELYGDRQSIMLKLFDRGTNNLYSFDSSKNVLDKFENPTLYQGTDGWYQRFLDMDVSNNVYLYLKDPLHIDDKVLVMTAAEISLIQNNVQLNAYNIWPLNISLMGINPVKDIDYTVYDASLGLGFRSDYFYNREDDASTYNIFIGAGKTYSLDIQGSYIVKFGTGTINGSSYTNLSLFNTFDSSVLISATTNTIITYALLDGSHNYSGYTSTLSEENISTYYDSSVLLKYGLTVPLVSKWVNSGTDVRNNPLRLILDASFPTLTVKDSSKEISYPSFKYLTPGNKAWQSYVFYDINDVINDGSIYLTFKEAIFEYPYVDYFSKLIYSNYNVSETKNRSSIVYYNGYKNALSTIFSGLNISIKVENIAKNTIDVKKYDRYRFSFISTASKNKSDKHPIEVIINENTKTILMIWYQGNDELNYNLRYSSFLPGKSLLDPSNLGFVTDIQIDSSFYSFVKTPYYINNLVTARSRINMYDHQVTYDSSIARPYAQLNKNLSGFHSIWNAFGDNVMSSQGSMAVVPKSYNTFKQYVSYQYESNSNTFGNYATNYGYHYNSNKNLYVNNTTNIDTLKFLLNPAYINVMYYILRRDDIFTTYDFGSTNPITITINDPRNYGYTSTYNGWFKPKFNTILGFNSNETDELINIVDKDFVFSNTNLLSYNNIPQLWYNKVVTTVLPSDISSGNAISYVSNYNVFKALWDADYYIKDNVPIDGYISPDELPSFFGSKLPKLPDAITLENWDITTASATQTSNETTLTFNLTTAILNKFLSNLTFTTNWVGFSNANVDAYVRSNIITYYNISQPKIKVDFYYRPFATQLLYYTYDTAFINDGKQNFNGQLIYQNNEYTYKIIIPRSGNFSYFVKFTMTEK
jgi:hypothetical protein